MSGSQGHKHADSVVQNNKAQLANAYNELGKELSSTKIKVVGNYTLGKVIGEGAYGKVRMGTHRLTSTRVAIKQIPKAMSASLTREIHHHRQLHHPNVTQMYEVIATESSIWIVTELCCGGELFDYLVEKGRLSEEETRILFGQTCLATAYLHQKGIVHRDLKLENVLLDERCRVKLGDFGFTREFERGGFLETFCGTTGYASPEMLQGKRYTGPEVDVWSLGVILYCLLTGTLPFDDDSEEVMRDKIIQGDFEDPEWLSPEARDLIQKILQQDVAKRITIPQILAHPWFTTRPIVETRFPETPLTTVDPYPEPVFLQPRATSPDGAQAIANVDSQRSSEASTSTASYSSDRGTSVPTTPEEASSINPFDLTMVQTDTSPAPEKGIHRNPSELTIRTQLDDTPKNITTRPETVPEDETLQTSDQRRPASSLSLSRPAPPPPLSVRTPARTKRRSVSSTLSVPGSPSSSPTIETSKPLTPLPVQDFSSLLSTPAPIIFSTPLERDLLNSLSTLGFDTGQIVHSVLSDACDAAGAVWWMMKRKAERRILEEEEPAPMSAIPAWAVSATPSKREESGSSARKRKTHHKMSEMGVQTDETAFHLPGLSLARSAPQLAFVPPTPTMAIGSRGISDDRPHTPPSKRSLLLPSSGDGGSAVKSHPSTPNGSLKDRDGLRGRKARSGSVSIMQRAATALEAAGLVRKKSSDAMREDKERDKEREKSKEASAVTAVLERSGGSISKGTASTATASVTTVEEPARSSHGSGSSKKSPKMAKEPPSTPPPLTKEELLQHPRPQIGSPWVMAGLNEAVVGGGGSHPNLPSHMAPPTPANSPGEMHRSFIHGNENGTASGSGKSTGTRNRANLLTAFRLWFGDDRKGKRKEANSSSVVSEGNINSPAVNPRSVKGGSMKRRMSGSNGKFPARTSSMQRPPIRQSISSRRSSSLNSRRSSGASVHMVMLDSPHVVTHESRRRSFGSHTPNSERGDPTSSRPSSIRSFSMATRHRKSPSASSAGSTHYTRNASPSMQKYHRRQGSGSSTRVVRQPERIYTGRPLHGRSNSNASSTMHSPGSSRPVSFYEESDGIPRTASPFRHRRSTDDSSSHGTPRRSGGGSTTFVAQKRQGPFMSPMSHNYSYTASFGRSSWKKSWGLEPPGWQTRTAHLPIEVLAISPASDAAAIRDVFSGRTSLNLGDESDWVDEDDFDGVPAFVGGLGQLAASASGSNNNISNNNNGGLNLAAFGLGLEPNVMTLAPAPRGHRNSSNTMPGASKRTAQKNGHSHSPAERASPIPPETDSSVEARGSGRRQLPAGRSGPAFKHAIQEEDEGEEE